MAEHQKPKVEKDTAERWLLTYADLMNLLLIFFIILYAISQTDVAKFNALAESLRAQFGDPGSANIVMSGGTTNSLIPIGDAVASSVIPSSTEEQQMEEVKEQVNELIQKKNLSTDVQVVMEERGIRISIASKLLFKSGSAEVEADSRPTIGEIGDILRQVSGNNIRVEGHTDTDPIRTSQYPSNWELSAARATTVLRLLVERSGIDPKKISSVGYGEFTPLVPNTSEVNKARNRRVDVVILRSIFDKSEAGASITQENSTNTKTPSNTDAIKPANEIKSAPAAGH